jgi:hypothetical protein
MRGFAYKGASGGSFMGNGSILRATKNQYVKNDA